jgi:hypothetical protein
MMTMKNANNQSRIRLRIAIAAVIAVTIFGTICYADNPVVQTVYTADPAPMVYKDTLYVYTGHDEDGAKYFEMNDWRCFSTNDMVNWTHHGSPLSWKSFEWSKGDCWAGQCIERDGKFYYYVPTTKKGGGMVIGVAVSDSPTGPFKDPLGHPLVEAGWGDIDPSAFIDADGQAYLYWGNPALKYVKLNKDMISYDKTVGVVTVPLTAESFGKRTGNKDRATLFEEAPWFYKRNGLYYMVYAASGIPENIAYATSSGPTGPWTYRGIIMPTQGGSFTNHPGLIDYKGKSYFFYHNGALPGGGGFARSVCVEQFNYNDDGTFPTMNMTPSGPSQIGTLNPYVQTEAETICWESGIETETCSEGGIDVCNIENGDYIKVKGVDFGAGATSFEARVASATSGGNIEIRLDSPTGTLAGTCAVAGTGGWQTWVTQSCPINGASGVHDLYFKFSGGSGSLFNFNWWKFEALTAAAVQAESAFRSWAKTPPMGWNSWDCFGTTVTEEQTRQQADVMAEKLKSFGWEYVVVDIQWYEPGAKGHGYMKDAVLTMDEFSRLLPAPEKFPSAANGKGFKPLADYVHSKGLKFGIHMMRGIPRQAVGKNTRILGSQSRAADIAVISSTCPWNPDMYGVDMNKDGAQQYYDSLYALFASWGVDFVKVDDISRAYDEVQKAEIEAIRKAIDKSGRPMVLSLSPGDTPIQRGEHVMNHANMWRISDDFWDRWPPLHGMFGRLEKWTKYRAAGAWPDADMLPFGIIEFNRPTRFTKEEQIFCMTLWSIARSPLMLGADMTKLDDFTLDLLTNKEVLAVNQDSINNRLLSSDKDLIVWAADVPDSKDKYIAFFNAKDNSEPFDLSKADYRSRDLRGEPKKEVIDINVPIHNAHRLVLAVGDGGDGNFYDHAAWIEPKVTGSAGTLKLTDLDWKLATSGWGQVHKNKTVDGRPLTLNGREVEGIGTHAVSVIEFELPDGYDTFTARGVITEGSQGKGGFQFLVLVDPDKQVLPERSRVSASLSELGIHGKARVRDLWTHKDLGEYSESFGIELPLHSAGLFRITPTP